MSVFLKALEAINWEGIMLSGFRILLIVVIAWILVRVVRILLRKMEQKLIRRGEAEGEVPSETAKRAETLARLLRQGVIILIWVMVILMALREFGVEIGPILASAGVAGLAIGFGAQNLVRDVISGFFLILENTVRVGDVAVVNGTGGLVEKINFRTIVLRDLQGVVHTFPNGSVTTISNVTREWSGYVFDIGVAYKEDTDQVVGILRDVGSDMRQDERFRASIVEDIEVFGVDQFADSAVIIKGRIKTLPIKQWEVGREFLRRVKKAFDQAGIEIPFPHRSIYFGEKSSPILAQLVNNEAGARK